MMTVESCASGPIDPGRSIGELVVERPARARLFERLRIDYCCGGRQTLAEACAKADAQIETVQVALKVLDESDARTAGGESIDWSAVDTARLCEHIVHVHHDCLRRTLPRIDSLAASVAEAHEAEDSTLTDVHRAVGRIRRAMEPHLACEETELFPAILAAERGGPPVAEEVLAGHEHEHREVGAALAELRGLCHDYDRDGARCATHRVLLDALEGLELDLHHHVHKENNVLFPRARQARSPAAGPRHPPARPTAPVAREPRAEPRANAAAVLPRLDRRAGTDSI